MEDGHWRAPIVPLITKPGLGPIALHRDIETHASSRGSSPKVIAPAGGASSC